MSRKSYTKKMAAREEKKKQEIEAKGKPRTGGGPAFSGDWYMLFGDYEGCWISSLPDEYVKMVAKEVSPDEHPEIAYAAKTTLCKREEYAKLRKEREKRDRRHEQFPRRSGGPQYWYDAKMPFGKYKDCWISSLPVEYLAWIIEDVSPEQYPKAVIAAYWSKDRLVKRRGRRS